MAVFSNECLDMMFGILDYIVDDFEFSPVPIPGSE